MITLSDEALAFIHEKGLSVCIDIPQVIGGCCIEIVECPAVRLGEPKAASGYTRQVIQGVTVFVPGCFPQVGDFVIRSRSRFGFKSLVIDGWRLA